MEEKIKQINEEIANKNISADAKEIIASLLNIVTTLYTENQKLKKQIQELKDELNNLKGEKGKPKINGNKKGSDYSAKEENNSKGRKKWMKKSKKSEIHIDREEVVDVEKGILPEDVKFHGYVERVIQNVTIRSANVKYKLKKYYSKSTGKWYTAELPEELKNTNFHPELKAQIIRLYYEFNMTEPQIFDFLQQAGIVISIGQIAETLCKRSIKEEGKPINNNNHHELFSQERIAIFRAMIMKMLYAQIDDSGGRVNGINHYMTVIGCPFSSVFFINKKKNREMVRQMLSLSDEEVLVLLADDAGQFDKVTTYRQLCWIHEIRHYKKMIPLFEPHKEILSLFISDVWGFYFKLKEYKQNPTLATKKILDAKFDTLMLGNTGYDELDKRIGLTRKKKINLLTVLDFPEVPIHNNGAELDIRKYATKRKISIGPRSPNGKEAWENYYSIMGTCKKLGICFYDYLVDIISGKNSMPKLAELIFVA